MKRKTKPITGGRNGYPVPQIGMAHFLRSLNDQGKTRVIKEGNMSRVFNESVGVFHWKTGWTFCEYLGDTFDPEKWLYNSLCKDYDEVIKSKGFYLCYENGDLSNEISINETSYNYDTHNYALGYFRKG